MQPSTDKLRSINLSEVASALRTSYSGITDIESVIRTTTVSTQEINDEFGGMDGIVIALAEQLSTSLVEPLGQCATAASFREQLQSFAERVTDQNTKSQLKSLYRIALTDAIRNTGLAPQIYRRGPGLLFDQLAKFIERAQQHGIVRKEDSRTLASHFMAILRAHLDMSDCFSPDLTSEACPVVVDVSSAVRFFSDGVQTRHAK